MTTVAPLAKSSSRPLHPRGRPHMRVRSKCHQSARGTRTVLRLPPRKQLQTFVRDQIVPRLHDQMGTGEKLLHIAIDDDEVGLDITIDPAGSPYSSVGFAAYNVSGAPPP